MDENGETNHRAFAYYEEKRLKILMGFYVRNCGSHRITLGLQMFMMQRFQTVQSKIKHYSGIERNEHTRSLLDLLDLPQRFHLPLPMDSTLSGLEISGCRSMVSCCWFCWVCSFVILVLLGLFVCYFVILLFCFSDTTTSIVFLVFLLIHTTYFYFLSNIDPHTNTPT